MKINSYKVVNTKSKTDMERIVNSMIEASYIPFGGICACYCADSGEVEFNQVMILENTDVESQLSE